MNKKEPQIGLESPIPAYRFLISLTDEIDPDNIIRSNIFKCNLDLYNKTMKLEIRHSKNEKILNLIMILVEKKNLIKLELTKELETLQTMKFIAKCLHVCVNML